MLKKFISIFIKPIEESSVPMFFFWLTAGAYIYIRNFLESIFESLHFLGLSPITLYGIEETFLHLPLFYLVIFTSSIIFLKLFLGKKGTSITKVVLFYSFIIALPPIVDIMFKRTGYRLLYPMRMEWVPRILGYLFGIVKEPPLGITPGMQFEVIIGVISVMVYGFLCSRNVLKTVLSLLGPLVGIVLAGGAQIFIAHISNLVGLSSKYNQVYFSGGLINSPSRKYAFVLFWVFLALIGFWSVVSYPGKIRKNCRIIKKIKLILYSVAVVAGFAGGWWLFKNIFTQVFHNIFDYLLVISLPLYGALFA